MCGLLNMMTRIRLLLDYFAINCARERRNFIRLFFVFLCICIVLLGFNSRSRLISEWQNANHVAPFIVAYSMSLILFVAVITMGLQTVLAFFLAYSLAVRRAHTLGISVGDWIQSEDYRSGRHEFLKMSKLNPSPQSPTGGGPPLSPGNAK